MMDATTAQAAAVGHRLGRIAALLVPALIVAGLVMAYVLVSSIAARFSTGYGLALLIKIALGCGLLGVAAQNKLRFVPKLREDDGRAARHLGQAITLEWGGVLAILMVTAILTSILNLPA